ncbi:MAG: class I SAM-dependent methyltransferase [Bdellovibrionota bacterium]
MSHYDQFAQHYDALMGGREECGREVKSLLRIHAPRAKSILELGCGTGSILRQLSRRYELTGVDLSAGMLEVARKKVPHAQLFKQDISRLNVSGKFDVILCLFDTINHLPSFGHWKRVFRRAHSALNDGGVFIFDINTVYGLEHYAERSPFAEFYPKGIGIFDANQTAAGRYQLDLRLLRRVGRDTYRLHRATIRELVMPTETITAELKKYYRRIELLDTERKKPSAKSEELYFVCKK